MQITFADLDGIYLSLSKAAPRLQTALNELQSGLRQLGYPGTLTQSPRQTPTNTLLIQLAAGSTAGESYQLRYNASEHLLTIDGANDLATQYAVFDFLERQGAYFGLDGAIYPPSPVGLLHLPDEHQPWSANPLFNTRGLQPWPDFLNCITVANEEDLRAYLEAMHRMRLNTLGLHVYAQSDKWVEPFLSFEYAGVGHYAFADTTATDRWGYLPQRTSRYGMGAAQFFSDEVFGSDAARLARDPWEAAERAQAVWAAMSRYADELGIRTGIGFEPHQLPDEIVRACPPEVRTRFNFGNPEVDGSFALSLRQVDPGSRTARYILEARLDSLLEQYPTVSYIQLWEGEYVHFTSKQAQIETPMEPYRQAYQYLQRHAPDKRLVIAGWGGVVRNFDRYHRELPEDIIFAALNDQVGWEPIHEAFGRLEGRERWPIPWLEDDPSMWFPQLHVSRFESDIQRAQDYGCTGLFGIHWRHRIVDPVAGYLSQRMWDAQLTTEAHYQAYARTQSSSPSRAQRMGKWFEEVDRQHRLLSTWTGRTNDKGEAIIQEFSGDYSEGFRIELDRDIEPEFIAQQADVLKVLHDLWLETGGNPVEQERFHYWYGQAQFVDDYARAWQAGRELQKILTALFQQRRQGQPVDPAQVEGQTIPLWLTVLRHMRQAVLLFQRTIATRNDLGMLASIHNKFVRISVFRLQASLLEFVDTLPADAVNALHEALAPDSSASPTVIVPTRPSCLTPGNTVRIMAIAVNGTEPVEVRLEWREMGGSNLHAQPMDVLGRRTYTTDILMPSGTQVGIEYRVVAQWDTHPRTLWCSAPADGFYSMTRLVR